MAGRKRRENFFGPPASDDDSNLSTAAETAEEEDFLVWTPSHPSQTVVGNETSALRSAQLQTNDKEMDAVSLRILRQPEHQHRARYPCEGSRGSIKDVTGRSHCVIQLMGHNRPTRVEMYAGTESEPCRPHPRYRLTPVAGKGLGGQPTPCDELLAFDGAPCIQILLHPENKMTALLDCIGILKLNDAAERKRKHPRDSQQSSIRLVFRASIPDACGRKLNLRVVSNPISCVQHLGYPEVHRLSLKSCSVLGGQELFIIGRNFDKNAKVIFCEYNQAGKLVWTSEAAMDDKLMHKCHLVCQVPTYRDLNISNNLEISMRVECAQKKSHPLPFTYTPTGTTGHVGQLVQHQNSWENHAPNQEAYWAEPQFLPSQPQFVPHPEIPTTSAERNSNFAPNLSSIVELLEPSENLPGYDLLSTSFLTPTTTATDEPTVKFPRLDYSGEEACNWLL